MECELCGRGTQLVKAEIEGVILSVCSNCSNLGRKAEFSYDMPDRPKMRIDEKQIKPDFVSIIRKARTDAGLTIIQLAEKIGVKSSVLERIEHGMRPTNDVANKLEKALKIKLLGVEEVDYETQKTQKFSQSLGDVAVFKKK